MAICSVTLSIDNSLAAPEFAHGVEQGFWSLIHRVAHQLYFELWAIDGQSYVIEMQCDRLGDEPIRGRFVDPINYASNTGAWPRGNSTFAGWFKWDAANLFICWPSDRSGVEHHADWRALEYWKRSDNQIVQYLEFIHRCLNLPTFGYLPRERLQIAS
jgi:hypothetical protein